MRHPVQCRHLEKKFRRLPGEGAGVHRRPEERLAAKEGGFGQTAPMIARLLFPPAPALLPERPQVLIPLPGSARAVAMLPDLGVAPWRNDRCGSALCECVVAVSLVIGPVGT